MSETHHRRRPDPLLRPAPADALPAPPLTSSRGEATKRERQVRAYLAALRAGPTLRAARRAR